MSKRILGTFGVVATMVVGACDDACVQPVVGEVTEREGQTNGILMNGILMNGILMNGILMNGILMNGAKLTSPGLPQDYILLTEFTVKGQDVVSNWVVGSEWRATIANGTQLANTQLDKAKLTFEVFEGGGSSEFAVKIRDVTQLAPGSDIWLYDLDVKKTGTWEPLCVDAYGESTEAILLSQVWQTSGARLSSPPQGSLTFACRGAALAKCVEFGYKPWASKNGVSLAEAHQACSRMVRADYCGNGVTHTVNGTPVHVLDQLGIQNVDPNVQYVVEAEWGPDGAVCLNSTNRRHPELALGCDIPACGPSFASGGLIQSGKVVQAP